MMSKKTLAVFLTLSASPVAADQVVVAALGDSLTQGYGLQQADGLVPQLETWLTNAGADVKMINAGVSGDTTAGGFARVAWTLTDDVDFLMVALGGNDLLRGLPVAEMRANLQGIVEYATSKSVPVSLVEMRAPLNYGVDYKTAFDTTYSSLASEFGTGLIPPFFDGLIEGEATPDTIVPFMQADGIHPNADGVAKIVAHIGPVLLEQIEALR